MKPRVMIMSLSLWCEVRASGLVQLFRLEEARRAGTRPAYGLTTKDPTASRPLTILSHHRHTGTHNPRAILMITELSKVHGVWVPACAGTTTERVIFGQNEPTGEKNIGLS